MRKARVSVEPVLTLGELQHGQREIERQAERTLALANLREKEASAALNAATLAQQQAWQAHQEALVDREAANQYLTRLRGV